MKEEYANIDLETLREKCGMQEENGTLYERINTERKKLHEEEQRESLCRRTKVERKKTLQEDKNLKKERNKERC